MRHSPSRVIGSWASVALLGGLACAHAPASSGTAPAADEPTEAQAAAALGAVLSEA